MLADLLLVLNATLDPGPLLSECKPHGDVAADLADR
jgi:hypothetical protein